MKTSTIIGLSVLGLGAGAVVFYLMKKKTISMSDKTNRQLTFGPSYCMAGLFGTVNIDLPAISDSFYQDYEIPQNREKLDRIILQYGSMVKNISALTNIPENLIYSFIFIESGGDNNAVNGKAIGLMQIGYNSATDIIYTEHKRGRLNEGEAVILRNNGVRLDSIQAMRSPGTDQIITQFDLFNPETNILLGSIYLGQLIDESMDQGSLRLEKVVVRYNMGYYSYSKGRQLIGDTLAIINKVNPITKQYITKLIGKNGILELLESENCG